MWWAKPVGRRLQRRRLGDGKEDVVVLAKPIPARLSSCSMKLWPLR
jgi:hypothetical protein